MTLFHEQDLSGSEFRRVSLRGSTFTEAHLTDLRIRDVDLSGTEVRAAYLSKVRLSGVELVDVEISGELRGVVVNGVDIGPLVEAELDRRTPDRVRMRPVDADGFRDAWSLLGRLWDETVDRARTLPEEDLHRGVDGEWSFVETLRHLGFVTATWVGGLVLRDRAPWHPWDLPWDEAPPWDGVPHDRAVRPTLDEVLAVRRERRAVVQGVLDTLTDERLPAVLANDDVPGWPMVEQATVAEALRVVLNEEWEHRSYAERDLAALGAGEGRDSAG